MQCISVSLNLPVFFYKKARIRNALPFCVLIVRYAVLIFSKTRISHCEHRVFMIKYCDQPLRMLKISEKFAVSFALLFKNTNVIKTCFKKRRDILISNNSFDYFSVLPSIFSLSFHSRERYQNFNL